MGIFTIIQIIFFAITNLPAAIKAIKEILEIIRQNRSRAVRKRQMARVVRTMKSFKAHGDPERLGREIKQMKAEFKREL